MYEYKELQLSETLQFLTRQQRLSILTRDIDIAILSVRPSVCPPVRLSVTRRYQMKTA